MGADIYLLSVHEPCKARWEAKFSAAVALRNTLSRGSAEAETAQQYVEEAYDAMYAEGYFRDCYNRYGLFAQIDFSWWRDVEPMLTKKDGKLPIRKAKELRANVAVAKFRFTKEVKKEYKGKIRERNETYEKWRKELLDILDASISLNEPLCCSL